MYLLHARGKLRNHCTILDIYPIDKSVFIVIAHFFSSTKAVGSYGNCG